MQSAENVWVWTEFPQIFWEQNDIGAIWAVFKILSDFESNRRSVDRKENHFGIKSSSTNKLSGKNNRQFEFFPAICSKQAYLFILA